MTTNETTNRMVVVRAQAVDKTRVLNLIYQALIYGDDEEELPKRINEITEEIVIAAIQLVMHKSTRRLPMNDDMFRDAAMDAVTFLITKCKISPCIFIEHYPDIKTYMAQTLFHYCQIYDDEAIEIINTKILSYSDMTFLMLYFKGKALIVDAIRQREVLFFS